MSEIRVFYAQKNAVKKMYIGWQIWKKKSATYIFAILKGYKCDTNTISNILKPKGYISRNHLCVCTYTHEQKEIAKTQYP